MMVVGALSSAFSVLAAAIGLILSPIALAIAAGVALGVALYAIADALDIGDRIKQWVEAFKRGISRIVDFVKNLPSKMMELGRELISSLVKGMLNGLKAIDDALGGWGQKIIGGFKSIFKMGSPSQVMLDLGQNVGMSFVGGVGKGMGMGLKQLIPAVGQMGAGVGGAFYQAIARNSYQQMGGKINAGIGNINQNAGIGAAKRWGAGAGGSSGQVFVNDKPWALPSTAESAKPIVQVNIENSYGTPRQLATDVQREMARNLSLRGVTG